MVTNLGLSKGGEDVGPLKQRGPGHLRLSDYAETEPQTYFVFEREPANVVVFFDRKLQENFADVHGADQFQRFDDGGVQHGAVVRPKHFDVTVIVQPVKRIPMTVDCDEISFEIDKLNCIKQ